MTISIFHSSKNFGLSSVEWEPLTSMKIKKDQWVGPQYLAYARLLASDMVNCAHKYYIITLYMYTSSLFSFSPKRIFQGSNFCQLLEIFAVLERTQICEISEVRRLFIYLFVLLTNNCSFQYCPLKDKFSTYFAKNSTMYYRPWFLYFLLQIPPVSVFPWTVTVWTFS